MRLSTNTKPTKPGRALCCLTAALVLTLEAEAVMAETAVPGDAKPSCFVTSKEFKTWLAGKNSMSAPDNLDFPQTRDDCKFFKRAEQMFLWVTSRSTHRNQQSYVFESSPFYTVFPLDPEMQQMIFAQGPSTGNQSKRASVAISQRGPQGERVLFSDTGIMHDIVQVEGDRRPVLERNGEKIEIGRIDIQPDEPPIFYDKQGNLVENPILRESMSGRVIEIKQPPGNTIVSNGQPFFLDQSGRAVAAQPGQADDHVLMAQGSKLVYYMIHANDVYAYFLTGKKNHKLEQLNVFPSGYKELDLVKKYARHHRMPSFPDERTLIVELKSSWIELSSDDEYANYVSIRADVPDFKMVSGGHWQQIGWRRDVKLAMVGMHVVFAVQGHPELIWATFEHVNNTPNERYRYDADGNQQPWSQQACGPWLFSSGQAEPDDHPRQCNGITVPACTMHWQTVDATGSCVDANIPRIYREGSDIYAYDKSIAPTDVLRISAWGNLEAPTFTARVISINNSIRRQLAADDVRKKYIMIGAIWRANPLTLPGSGGTDCKQSETKGSKCVANSTMETFQQPSNCLFCHKMSPMDMLEGVSHIYKPLNPLFPESPNR
jgi:hypothetical protein